MDAEAKVPPKVEQVRQGDYLVYHMPCPECGRTISTITPDQPQRCMCGCRVRLDQQGG